MGDIPAIAHFAERHLRITLGAQRGGIIAAQLAHQPVFDQRCMHQPRHNRIAAHTRLGVFNGN